MSRQKRWACHRGPREGEVIQQERPAQGRRQTRAPARSCASRSSAAPDGGTAGIGDIFVATVKDAVPGGGREEGRSGQVRRRADRARSGGAPDGSYIRFDEKRRRPDQRPAPTRVAPASFGPVGRELRDRRFMRIVSLAPEVL